MWFFSPRGACCWALLGLLAVLAPAHAAPPPVTALALAPDGKSLVVGSQAGLEVRTWPDNHIKTHLDTKLRHIHDLSFSPHGDVLAAAGGRPAERGEVEFYRWPEGTLIRRDRLHKDVVQALAWRPDGQHWATASADRTCQVHEAGSGKLLQVFTGHSRPVLAICYTPDGKNLLSAGIDNTIRLWEASTGRGIRSLDNHVAPVHALALRPQEDPATLPMLASASADRTVRLWQPTIGRMVRFIRLPRRPLSLAWTPDGKHLVAGCVDGHVRLIDPDTVRVLEDRPVLSGWLYSLVIHPGTGSILVGGPQGKVKRVDLPRQPEG
jgi:WD40 repeat protein